MSIAITAFYAGLQIIIMLVLAGMVGRARGAAKISLGDGGVRAIIVANRRHMNWVEYVPAILVMLAIIEANGASKTWVHVLGAVLLVARIVHPFGIDPDNASRPARGIGAGLTFLVGLGAAITGIWQFLSH